ncbi:hypothetical protein BC628DRAFT_1152898 [Trametes gibbosa]|nr:hypothetical protein BC628DRAFT_1152898 [Trametes gibbosa]
MSHDVPTNMPCLQLVRQSTASPAHPASHLCTLPSRHTVTRPTFVHFTPAEPVDIAAAAFPCKLLSRRSQAGSDHVMLPGRGLLDRFLRRKVTPAWSVTAHTIINPTLGMNLLHSHTGTILARAIARTVSMTIKSQPNANHTFPNLTKVCIYVGFASRHTSRHCCHSMSSPLLRCAKNTISHTFHIGIRYEAFGKQTQISYSWRSSLGSHHPNVRSSD